MADSLYLVNRSVRANLLQTIRVHQSVLQSATYDARRLYEIVLTCPHREEDQEDLERLLIGYGLAGRNDRPAKLELLEITYGIYDNLRKVCARVSCWMGQQ